jgi:hypothetical protein
VLSRPISDDPAGPNPGAGDWFVLIDGTDVNAIAAAIPAFTLPTALGAGTAQITAGVYNLMWDLARSDIRLS